MIKWQSNLRGVKETKNCSIYSKIKITKKNLLIYIDYIDYIVFWLFFFNFVRYKKLSIIL